MKRFLILLVATLSIAPLSIRGADKPAATAYDFRQSDSNQGWKINIFKDHPDGGRGRAAFELFEDTERGQVARLVSETAGRFNLISPEIALPTDAGNLIGFQLEYRTAAASDPLALIVCDQNDNIYSAPLPSTDGAWGTRTITSIPNSSKGTPPLNLANLKRIYLRGSGNVDISLAEIRFVFGDREIPLASLLRPVLVIPEHGRTSFVDGKPTEEAWKKAVSVPIQPAANSDPQLKYPSEIRALRSGSKLFLRAEMLGEPNPLAGNGTPDHNVWKDSSLEIFLKPARGNGPAYQLVVNSLNVRQDYQGSDASWNGTWKSSAIRNEDGWKVETEIDLAELDPAWNEDTLWRWNIVRNVALPKTSNKHGIAFRATLGGSVLTPQSGLFSFSPTRENQSPKGFSLIKTGPDEYSLGLPASAQKESTAVAQIFRVVDDRAAIHAGTVEGVSPLKLSLKESGLYHLEIETDGPQGREIALLELFASNPVQTQWNDIVLSPTPQKLEIGKESLPLRRIRAVKLVGEGDSFPQEHLSEEIARRYGPLGGADAEVDIELAYDSQIPEEGYHLAVNAGGVTLRASTGRGMYYGTRTLLDLLAQSSLDLGHPQIRHIQCQDEPRNAQRVLYYYLGVSRYKIPTSVESVKRYIYQEVAGRRYNLLILMIGHGYQYASAPNIRAIHAWTKEQLQEVLEFARRHYVEVAPGGESPGHANWLIPYYPGFGDEGEKKSLDLGNPEVLKTLLACYDELLEIFQPRYFHTGGDEYRLKWTETSRSPEERRSLLLAHWKALHQHLKSKGVRMLMWDDMVSPKWNGGPPLEAARILKDLPRDIIMCSWSDRGIDNPPELYDELGFKEHWKVTTSFDTQRADRSLGWWKSYDGLGIGIFTAWPWTAFVHANYITHTKYTTAALHLNSLLLWHPESLARGAEQVLANDGVHWMRAMSAPAFGRVGSEITPVPLVNTPSETVPAVLAPALSGFSEKTIGKPPFHFETKPGHAVTATAPEEAPTAIPISRKVAGLFFLQTTAVEETDLPELYRQFRYENLNPIGLEIATYEVHFEDGGVESVPVILGYNVHFYNAVPLARILTGSPAYFTGQPTREARALPAAWVMMWKNPRPEATVREVRLVSKNRYAPLALLGLTALGVAQ